MAAGRWHDVFGIESHQLVAAIGSRNDQWRVGETGVGWVWLFGFVPFSRHHLHIELIDESARMLSSREFGGVIRTWNHDIVVTPIERASGVGVSRRRE